MIILDTTVVSAMMNDPPEPKVTAWLDTQDRSLIWTTSVTVLEIESGLHFLSVGERRSGFSQVFERILNSINHRIAAFDEEAARQSALLMASRRKIGRPVEMRDTMIAGIVLAHRAELATRNPAHYADIDANVVNPWI